MAHRRRRCSGDSVQGDSSDTTDPYTFQDSNRQTTCLKGFTNLYETGQLFDISLCVDGKEFPCHKAMLASSSDYFRAMFTNNLAERDQEVVTINGVDATSMELLVNYLYTGEVKLTGDNVQNLLSAANLFQLRDLKEGCAVFMGKKLDEDNCIGIHFFAQAHECQQLEYMAWDIISCHFQSLASKSEFLELSVDNLIEIIKYDDLSASEEDIFEACTRWLDHDQEERRHNIFELFTEVRFALIEEHFFYDKVKTHPILVQEPRMEVLFEEVLKYKLLRSRWMECDLKQEPRYESDCCRVVVYTAYQDDEKKQVLQLYGQRSDEVTDQHGNVFCTLPTDIENPSLLVTGDNDLYVAGGDSDRGCALYKWVPGDDNFEDYGSMMIPRKQFCLVQVDRCMYAIGGCNAEGNLASVSKLDLEGEEDWELVSSMPKALRCFCATAYGGKLYVFGGESEKINKKVLRGKTELSKEAFCYDPRENKWSRLAEMKTARALAGCTIFHKKIYVIGGFGSITESWVKDKSPENCLPSVEIYDPASDTWEEGPDLPIPLCAMGVVKYYGTIYILGGENDEDVSSHVYLLSSEDNKWELRNEMVTGVTETTIHSSYAVMNVDVDSDHGSEIDDK